MGHTEDVLEAIDELHARALNALDRGRAIEAHEVYVTLAALAGPEGIRRNRVTGAAKHATNRIARAAERARVRHQRAIARGSAHDHRIATAR